MQALANELAKNLKTPEDLSHFDRLLKKISVEAALNAEMTHHLGYDKNQPKPGTNARNGYSTKTVTTGDGPLALEAAVGRLAIAWAGGSDYATDVLFAPSVADALDDAPTVRAVAAQLEAQHNPAEHALFVRERLPLPARLAMARNSIRDQGLREQAARDRADTPGDSTRALPHHRQARPRAAHAGDYHRERPPGARASPPRR